MMILPTLTGPPGQDIVWKAILDFAIAAITLLATWFVGNGIANKWSLRQKRNELNLESVRQFHALYGELKEAVKVWRLQKREKDIGAKDPAEQRWNMLNRSCAIESKAETVVLRLATERRLSAADQLSIGLFRQAVQTLRESIAQDIECPLGSRGAEYQLLNELASVVGAIASARLPNSLPSARRAGDQLNGIARVTAFRWFQAVQIRRLEKLHKARPGEPLLQEWRPSDMRLVKPSEKIEKSLQEAASRTIAELQPDQLARNIEMALEDAVRRTASRSTFWPIGGTSGSIGYGDGGSFEERAALLYDRFEQDEGVVAARGRLRRAGVDTKWLATEDHGVRAICLAVEVNDGTLAAVGKVAKNLQAREGDA